jgi:hypothetical protein
MVIAVVRRSPPMRGMCFGWLSFGEFGVLEIKVVFRKEKFNVYEVCVFAWKDVVYAGMACHTRLLAAQTSRSRS